MAGCGRGRRGKGRKRSDDGWSGWGGYMNAKIEKLDKQGSPQKRVSDLFKGVAIFVNGYTSPPQDELKRLILENGGTYHHYYNRTKVTHIIASNLAKSKVIQLHDEKVVKPNWITESIRAGRLFPYQTYLLHDPRGGGHGPVLLASPRSTDSVLLTSSCFENIDDPAEQSPCGNSDPELNFTSGANFEHYSNVDALSQQITRDNSVKITSAETIEENLLVANRENVSSVTTNKSVGLKMTERLTASNVAKAGDVGFVSEFYNHSRLHHLSMWSAEFKSYVASLQKMGRVSYPGREKLRQMVAQREQNFEQNFKMGLKSAARHQQVMMHVDMDCFFVSVAVRSRPGLKGFPVAVTHSKGKGPLHNEGSLAVEEAYWNQRSSGPEKVTSASEEGLDVGRLDQNVVNKLGLTKAAQNRDIYYSMAEIASCSYEARQAGVKNGMLFGKAKQLCPELIPVPYDFESYKEVSQQLYDTVGSYTLDIEAVSCDELYIDCSDVITDTGASPLEFSSLLRQEIFEKTRCTASVGLGRNMLLARLATKIAKPNGHFWVEPDKTNDFIKDVLASDLPGVGHVMSKKLEKLNIRTCGELQVMSLAYLQKNFGQKTGQMLCRYARGDDERTLKTAVERKSVSAEINYGIRFTKINEAEKFLGELSCEVQNRLKAINRKGQTITLKLKARQEGAPKMTAKFMGHGICDSFCKSSTLPMATDNADIIAQECCSLLRQSMVDPEDLRGVGIQMTFLEAPIGPTSTTSCRSISEFTAPITKEKDIDSNHASSKSDSQSVNKTLLSGAEKHVNSFFIGSSRPVSGSGLNNTNCVAVKSSNAESLPPLPSLGSMCSNFEEAERTTDCDLTASLLSHIRNPYLPSPSQVDEGVLDELPSDIQMEIRQALKQAQLGSSLVTVEMEKQKASQSIIIDDGEQPGCSHWVKDDARNHLAKTHEEEMTLPPYSQVDPGFMGALPMELQEEIENAYAFGFSQSCAKPQEPDAKVLHPLMRVDIRNTSPGKKKHSPKKLPGKKGSPCFKVPTGKPSGSRKSAAQKRVLFPTKPVLMLNEDSTGSTVELCAEASLDLQLTIDRQSAGETARPQVCHLNLAGCVTLDEVRKLFHSWILSSSAPKDGNLKALFQYLNQLIQTSNLEKVDILLQFINRISNTETLSREWKAGSQWVINQVQSVMLSLYGGPIKLPVH